MKELKISSPKVKEWSYVGESSFADTLLHISAEMLEATRNDPIVGLEVGPDYQNWITRSDKRIPRISRGAAT